MKLQNCNLENYKKMFKEMCKLSMQLIWSLNVSTCLEKITAKVCMICGGQWLLENSELIVRGLCSLRMTRCVFQNRKLFDFLGANLLFIVFIFYSLIKISKQTLIFNRLCIIVTTLKTLILKLRTKQYSRSFQRIGKLETGTL